MAAYDGWRVTFEETAITVLGLRLVISGTVEVLAIRRRVE